VKEPETSLAMGRKAVNIIYQFFQETHRDRLRAIEAETIRLEREDPESARVYVWEQVALLNTELAPIYLDRAKKRAARAEPRLTHNYKKWISHNLGMAQRRLADGESRRSINYSVSVMRLCANAAKKAKRPVASTA